VHAIQAAPAHTPTRIAIATSFAISARVVIPHDKVITLAASGGEMPTLRRAAGYAGELIEVYGQLTLRDLVLDGNLERMPAATGALVCAQAGSTLHIGAGAVLQRNSNAAQLGGGAIYCAAQTTFTMTGGCITGNRATAGGGIHVSGVFELTGGEITGNTAVYGGGVMLSPTASCTMHAGRIAENHAASVHEHAYGGGVFVYSTFSQQGGEIVRNDSTHYGGGVYHLGAYTLHSGLVGDNAARTGGGIMSAGGIFTCVEAIITGNRAAEHGGGLYLFGAGGTARITDTDLTANTAQQGGGLFVAAGFTLTLAGEDMLIADNAALSPDAGDSGGGIRSADAHLTLGDHVIFTRNYAVHAYNLPLSSNMTASSAAHTLNLDPQYSHPWNNADISCQPGMLPTMQITYWRNAEPGDPVHETLGSMLNEGAPLPCATPPWEDDTRQFAGWSLHPADTGPLLQWPAKVVYHRHEWDEATPPNLNVYAIWYLVPQLEHAPHAPVPASEFAPKPTPVPASVFVPKPARVSASELATLDNLTAALEAHDTFFNVALLTEDGNLIIDQAGLLYLYEQRIAQHAVSKHPLTVTDLTQFTSQVDIDEDE
jgi:hypothetical protein